MKKESRSILLSALLVPIGGILVLGICYLLYYALYMSVETLFFSDNPTLVPAGIIRRSYAIGLLILYLFILRTKLSDRLKAILLIGPLSLLMITSILAFYDMPAYSVSAIAAFVFLCLFLLRRYKVSWIYYYASALSVLAAIFYAWPR